MVNNFSVILGRLLGLTSTILSNGDEVSCSRTQHHATGEDCIRDLAIKSLT